MRNENEMIDEGRRETDKIVLQFFHPSDRGIKKSVRCEREKEVNQWTYD